MFSRYKRLVPPAQREVIVSRGLPRPDWFVGAAEQPLDPRDPGLAKLLRDVDERLDSAAGGQGAAAQPGPAAAPAPTPAASTSRRPAAQ
jgi:hypothetical protein